VVLPEAIASAIRKQIAETPGARLAIDLPAQTVADAAGAMHSFEIAPVRKRCMLQGLDDIARTQQFSSELDRFETSYRKAHPWLSYVADRAVGNNKQHFTGGP
jgi:3-isopropylmalate/(R)-2-methylmalate dehydratase small subunit